MSDLLKVSDRNCYRLLGWTENGKFWLSNGHWVIQSGCAIVDVGDIAVNRAIDNRERFEWVDGVLRAGKRAHAATVKAGISQSGKHAVEFSDALFGNGRIGVIANGGPSHTLLQDSYYRWLTDAFPQLTFRTDAPNRVIGLYLDGEWWGAIMPMKVDEGDDLPAIILKYQHEHAEELARDAIEDAERAVIEAAEAWHDNAQGGLYAAVDALREARAALAKLEQS